MPPRTGVPAAVYPISVNAAQRAVAPPPLTDRYPLVVGQALNVTYLSSVSRLATTGYRLQLVDLLNELLEHDPHLLSVLSKRISSTANGRVEITPSPLPKDHPDFKLAQESCDLCQYEVDRIPDLEQALAGLLWSIYYGLAAQEIFWNRDSDGWHVDRLGFIHSRRLSYPDPQTFDLHLWDQGQVLSWSSPWAASPTNTGTFGLRIEDWPGKFIVHAPQLRGDYPTRDGLGRNVAVWSIFKRIGARHGADYLERFSKSFMDVEFNTPGEDGDGGDTEHAREASPEDIAKAESAAASIGPGSGSYFVHPSSVQINPKSFDGGSRSKITYAEWIAICNAEESKVVLGSTLGTEVGHGGGNRALGEVMERGESDLEGLDAKRLGATLKRDLLTWIVRLNRPECLHLVPNALIHVDKDPTPKSLLEDAKTFVAMGAPVDGDALSERVGIVLVPNEEKGEDGQPKPRRLFVSDVADPFAIDSDLMSEEAKQKEQDQTDADNAVAMQKAKQPAVAPGAGAGAKAPASKTVAKKTAAKPKLKAAAKAELSDRGPQADAAIAIVFDDDGRILTVSRPEPPHEQALPGGIVEDGETAEAACIRELVEETAIRITKARRLTTTASPVDGRLVHVFVAEAWTGGARAAEPNTVVRWMTPEALVGQAELYADTLSALEQAGYLDPSRVKARLIDDRHGAWCLSTIAMSDRDDKKVAGEVYTQLLEDYPANKLGWILSGHWSGPQKVEIKDIDFAEQDSWRASHEPIGPYVDRIKRGRMKPVILVKTPGNPKCVIVDGHHRTLAYKQLGWPVFAYVAEVHVDDGPWDELHTSQQKGSSRGSASWLESQQRNGAPSYRELLSARGTAAE